MKKQAGMKITKQEKEAVRVALNCSYKTGTAKSAMLTDSLWLKNVDINLKELAQELKREREKVIKYALGFAKRYWEFHELSFAEYCMEIDNLK